ncbi:uncharacterized protein LOC111462397 [Cucurbita moschata]|uniref:Uncharacterized protein LOC111462397 n=1 Tax=Cucurbita moschata TaxID=3662 RepID=A0A6J1HEU2_CUCMO|nr:uncharacterized protein LOC111462397 [Cucurbita moschata]
MLHSITQQPGLCVKNGVVLQKSHLKNQKMSRWKCFAVSKSQQKPRKDQNLLSVSLRSFSDIPLYEPQGKASFDQYLEDKPRLVKATFPGKSEQLNQEEWRIETPKIEFLFLKIWPTIDIKIISKTSGEGYPSDVPHNITKVLDLQMTNWELNGIHRDYRPSSANVCSRGAIYSEKFGIRSRLKFQLQINLSFHIPDALTFVPKDVFQSIVEKGLKTMVEDVKLKAMDRLVEDYCAFRKEKKK